MGDQEPQQTTQLNRTLRRSICHGHIHSIRPAIHFQEVLPPNQWPLPRALAPRITVRSKHRLSMLGGEARFGLWRVEKAPSIQSYPCLTPSLSGIGREAFRNQTRPSPPDCPSEMPPPSLAILRPRLPGRRRPYRVRRRPRHYPLLASVVPSLWR